MNRGGGDGARRSFVVVASGNDYVSPGNGDARRARPRAVRSEAAVLAEGDARVFPAGVAAVRLAVDVRVLAEEGGRADHSRRSLWDSARSC